MMGSPSILFKNGILLVHDAKNHVVPTKADLLTKDSKIAKIGQGLTVPDDVEIIDCTDKIISPGFVDTHHHGWQTQLKGRHANELLLEYMITGAYQNVNYSAIDGFWGQLGGMLEGISAGTTTVVDHAHIAMSPEHVKLGIAATTSSGIRAVYCYTPTVRIKSFSPLSIHENLMEDWVMDTFIELADQAPFGDGRVTLGFAWDLWFLPKEQIQKVFTKVEEKGIRTLTFHHSHHASIFKLLEDFGLLDERALVSHGGEFSKEDAELVRKKGARVSSTPSTELQMALGRPVCFDAAYEPYGDRHGIQDHASFGVDCHSNQAGSIISEARIGLQSARNHFNERYSVKGKLPRRLPDNLSVESAFNLATIKGAEAIQMGDVIGRIAEGYKADLVVFDALSPSMIGAAQHDPVAAVILHSNPGDIQVVMIDGIIRKNGTLSPIEVDEAASQAVSAKILTWGNITKEILKSREVIQSQAGKIDVAQCVEAITKMWHLDSKVVD